MMMNLLQSETIHDIFSAQVEKTPENIAVVDEDYEFTYTELNQKANQVAYFLSIRYKIKPDDVVGIIIKRSAWTIIGILGILKAGAAYIPIDPTYPEERKTYMLNDCACKIVLTDKESPSTYFDLEKYQICNIKELVNQQLDYNHPSIVSGNNLAYLIYTSGSTGNPKGVMIEHRNIINTLIWRQEYYGFNPSNVNLQFPSISFDSSVVDIFSILCSGGKLVLLKEELRTDLEYIEKLIAKYQVTHFLTVPSFYWIILTECYKKLSSLKAVTLAGEAVGQEIVNSHFALLPKVELINEYGPTENSVCSTACKLKPEEKVITIGKPISNVKAYILDAQLNQTAPMEEGQICLAGKGLSRGYWRNEELTAQKFIQNPFRESGERLYLTGDLGRINLDGNIEFLGRIDEQVKIRGYRIEPREIEDVLLKYPEVKEAVIGAKEVLPLQRELVAYIRSEKNISDEELKKHLGNVLPNYMIPTYFVFLDKIPRTLNGKLNKNALPYPARKNEHQYIAPQTSLEHEIAQILQELLGIQYIGIEDNFFKIGAHSLVIAQLVARINKTLEINATLKDVFDNPTIASLASKIETSPFQETAHSPIPVVSRDSYIPLTFQQEQVWFLHKLVPNNVAYNAQFTIQFQGELDKEILEKSLSEIIKRHEILRTTFPEVNAEAVQSIHSPWEAQILTIDLRDLPEQQRAERAEELIKQELAKPFDYTRLPLIRWYLYQLGELEYVFLNVEFHYVHDGWSVSTFLRELKALYDAYKKGKPSPFEEMPLQLADYAAWQRSSVQESLFNYQLAYWEKQLAGCQFILNLHTDRPRPKVPSLKGGLIRQDLPVELYRSLRKLSHENGVTLFTTLFAAFSNLLFRYTGQEDILIGTATANRRRKETENVLGMLVNMILLRANLAGNPTFKELLVRVQKTLFESLEHQDIPFQKIVEKVYPKRVPGMNPLFQVIFSFHDSPVPDPDFLGLKGHLTIRHSDSAKVDIEVICVPIAEQRIGREEREDNDRLTLMWQYNSDLFDRETMQKMIAHFLIMLEEIVAQPEIRIGQIEMLTKVEKTKLLTELKGTKVVYPIGATIHSLFEEQVKKTPDNIAVICDEKQLTYRELNTRANQLAHYLREHHHIKSDDVVGLMVNRSEQMIVGLLGILKAGGAYLPLEPLSPENRLSYMIQDSAVKVILTQTSCSQNLPSDRQSVLLLDVLSEELHTYPTTNLQLTNTGDDLVYIIYTSGSTGKPKGVLAKHSSLVSLVNWYAKTLNLVEPDSMLLIAPLSFDLAQKNIFAPLAVGASIYLSERMIGNYDTIADTIAKHQLTLVNASPSALYPLLETKYFDKLNSLRKLIFGGEPINIQKLTLWMISPHCQTKIINGYGPTECTGVVSAYTVEGDLPTLERIPIGKPIDNTYIYILTNQQQLLPPGIVGEICVSGVGLTRGYLNQESLTREKFISNPFVQGEYLYRTGDMGKLLPDGNIVFIGRNDEQVKVRGYRIEQGEIEANLQTYDKVSQAVILTKEDERNNKYLVAYIVAQEEINVTEIRIHLKQTLPEYMIPTYFIQVKQLPLTPNGKIDKQALLILEQVSLDTGIAYQSPRNDTEKKLAAIWQEVLKTDNIGIKDDFWALGGHSLQATRVISRVREIFQLELPLNSMFEDTTLTELSKRIDFLMWNQKTVQINTNSSTILEEFGEI
ncbi:MAG: amino acid adenylation domain-containing protein [Nostoc sp.]|uniref:amino acid adenylation domain-containing protein n=1 Tax=Nostoc sp. TaxID=1180 RepID=UPI002FF8569F